MPTKINKTKKPVKIKKIVVNRKFLTDLANDIYNSKNKTFLRLCNGKLQNGPDPTNSARPMHCGLGELYLAMTGRQPEEDGVDEEAVTELAVELSPLNGLVDSMKDKAIRAIESLAIPKSAKTLMVDTVEAISDNDLSDDEEAFRAALDEIPKINDDGCEDGKCDIATYRARSKRVAVQLKLAASKLPA